MISARTFLSHFCPTTMRQFRGKSSLATYLTVIARRIVVKEITQRRMSEALGHVQVHGASVEAAHAGQNESQRTEDREEVARMLKELPPREADVVRQFHLEGKSYREISVALGIPENSIGPTLNRARERMRQRNVTS